MVVEVSEFSVWFQVPPFFFRLEGGMDHDLANNFLFGGSRTKNRGGSWDRGTGRPGQVGSGGHGLKMEHTPNGHKIIAYLIEG